MSERKLPTQFELALLAAQLMTGTKGDPDRAAAEAVRIWETCGAELDAWPQRIRQREIALKAEADQAASATAERQAIQQESVAGQTSPIIFKSWFASLIEELDGCFPAGMTPDNPLSFRDALKWLMPEDSPARREVKFRHALSAADNVDTFKAGDQIQQLKGRQWFVEQRKMLKAFLTGTGPIT